MSALLYTVCCVSSLGDLWPSTTLCLSSEPTEAGGMEHTPHGSRTVLCLTLNTK